MIRSKYAGDAIAGYSYLGPVIVLEANRLMDLPGLFCDGMTLAVGGETCFINFPI